MDMPPTSTEKVKAPCNECGRDTLHDVLFKNKTEGSEDVSEEFSIEWWRTLRVLQCRGCEDICIRRDTQNSEDYEPEGTLNTTTTYIPPRVFRKVPDWIAHSVPTRTGLPKPVRDLMNELYIALQADCLAASAMLTRATFEHCMIQKIGDKGNFKANMKAFTDGGYISEKHAEAVDHILEAGHASIHRAYIPSREDVVTIIDILEGVLRVVYVQNAQAAKIRRKVPSRKKAAGKSKSSTPAQSGNASSASSVVLPLASTPSG